MTQAVSYLRVSGESQIDRGGFPRQVEDVNLFCEHSGFEIIDEYREEAVPGKLGEEHRPAFQRMVADLLSNGCRSVVVSSLDRFARQYDIQQQLATYLASKEIALYSANTGENITAALMGDPMRRAMVQMQGIFFELDKNLIMFQSSLGEECTREYKTESLMDTAKKKPVSMGAARAGKATAPIRIAPKNTRS